MKTTYYFSHDDNSQDDEKICRLIKDMGWEAYGIYWAIVERLHANGGYMRTDCERIAWALRLPEHHKIEKIINDYQLFIVNGEQFTSQRVLDNIKQRKSKSLKAKQSARIRWDATAMRPQCDGNAIKERKGKERKEDKDTTPLNDSNPPKNKPENLESVKAFCSEVSSSVDPQKFYDYYESNGWKVGKNKMKDWKAAFRNWGRSDFNVVIQKKEKVW